MQSAQKKAENPGNTQTTFDQMYAVQLDPNGKPINSNGNIDDFIPSPTYQIDPKDAVSLLRGPLLEAHAASSGTWTESERAVITDCVKRLSHCEKLVEATTTTGAEHMKRFSKEDFAFINKFVADSEAVLKVNVTDDTTWGSNVPDAIALKGMLGGVPLSDVGDELFQVRGKTYLADSKKVPAAPPLFQLRGFQVVEQARGSADLAGNVALRDWCGFPKDHDQYNEWLILNYMVPGTTTVNVVCLFTASREALEVINSISGDETPETFVDSTTSGSRKSPSKKSKGDKNSTSGGDSPRSPRMAASPVHKNRSWANSLFRFWNGPREYRDRTFKLFPRIVKASWAIQAAVGTKPALIGNKKLELKYIRGPGYLEVDIDMSSSTLATHILGMVRGVSKSMVIDLGVGIEGIQEDELPEAILCQARFDRVDLDGAAPLSTEVSAASTSSSSIFSFDYFSSTPAADTTTTSASDSDSAKASAEVDAVVDFSKLSIKEALFDAPAQKLRRALAVEAPTSVALQVEK